MMNKGILLWILLLQTLAIQSQDFAGTWYGKLAINGAQMRLVFHIHPETEPASGTMDSPDQGAYDIALESVLIKGDSLLLASHAIGFSYKGVQGSEGIVGRFVQNGYNVPLFLQREYIEASRAQRPQTPIEPFPYSITEVSFSHATGSHQLAGTLTLPRDASKAPLVILITGSGPQDRNEEILDHQPFHVLADYLTRQGIAVLRYDDRGVGESGGTFAGSTSADFASDVDAAIDWAAGHPRIDANHIGLIGHSEGAMIAAMAATRNPLVAFIVMMAGPGTPGSEIVKDQTRLILEVSGVSESSIDHQVAMQDRIFSLISQGGDGLEQGIRQILDESYADDSPEMQAYGGKEQWVNLQTKQFMDPWYQFFIQYDPVPDLKKLQCPVLALNGLLDLQVPCSKNLSAIEYATKMAGVPCEAHAFPGLNHLFQPAQSGLPAEYGAIETTIDLKVLEVLAAWIEQQVQ